MQQQTWTAVAVRIVGVSPRCDGFLPPSLRFFLLAVHTREDLSGPISPTGRKLIADRRVSGPVVKNYANWVALMDACTVVARIVDGLFGLQWLGGSERQIL